MNQKVKSIWLYLQKGLYTLITLADGFVAYVASSEYKCHAQPFGSLLHCSWQSGSAEVCMTRYVLSEYVYVFSARKVSWLSNENEICSKVLTSVRPWLTLVGITHFQLHESVRPWGLILDVMCKLQSRLTEGVLSWYSITGETDKMSELSSRLITRAFLA